jgi:two-component sensor histidine kinase
MLKKIFLNGLIFFKLFALEGNAQSKNAARQDAQMSYYPAFPFVSAKNKTNWLEIAFPQNLHMVHDRTMSSTNQSAYPLLSVVDLVKMLKITFSAFATTLLVLIFMYNNYIINKRQRKKTEAKNQMLLNTIIKKDQTILSKERLLKEIHHQIKNNLHMVICLLESQAKYLENDALAAIQASEHRIYAMLLIHQKLYLSTEVKAIDMSIYLKELLTYLEECFGTKGRINLQLKIEPLELCIAKAVPIALIINEAVTNGIKHAFPTCGKGIIRIKLTQKDRHIFVLIRDNGIGMDMALVKSKPNSFGLKLIKGLTEDIAGKLTFENRGGTFITVKVEADTFNYNNVKSAIKIDTELSNAHQLVK